mgnify:CR=1 FL=1
MKVVFFTSWYPNPDAPQHGDFIQRHAEAIAAHPEVELGLIFVKAVKKGPSKHIELREEMVNGVLTLRVFYRHSINPLLKAKRYRKAYEHGLEFFKHKIGKPDIINANVIWPSGIVAKRLAKKYKIPFVITEHWSAYYPNSEIKLNFPQRFKISNAVAAAKRVITVSKYLERCMVDMGFHGNYEQIPNVVNTSLFFPEMVAEDRDFTFVHISNFTENKRAVDILEAFDLALKQQPNLSLKFIGEGPELNEIKEILAEEPELSKKVKLHGSINHDAVAKELRSSDALLLFSKYEGLPCVILEAWCTGIPVISTNVGGIKDYFQHDSGILLQGESIEELSHAILEIAKAQETYDSTKISDYAKGQFSNKSIAKQFFGLYQRVLKD